jgi:hypothetical protein
MNLLAWSLHIPFSEWLVRLWEYVINLVLDIFNAVDLWSFAVSVYSHAFNLALWCLPSSVSSHISDFWAFGGGTAAADLGTLASFFCGLFISIDLLKQMLGAMLLMWPAFVCIRLVLYLKGHIWSGAN